MKLELEKRISPNDLIAAVRQLAEKSPNNHYRSPCTLSGEKGGCFYGRGDCDDGTIGCIIGQAFIHATQISNFGIQLDDADTGSIDPVMMFDAQLLFDPLPTGQQAAWAQKAQHMQDQGKTWAEAVAEADIAYPLEEPTK